MYSFYECDAYVDVDISRIVFFSLPIANHKKNPLKVSAASFLSSCTLYFASKFIKNRVDKDLEINLKEIEKAKSRNKVCYGCIYYNDNAFILCAVHPVTQPENCVDKFFKTHL